MKDLLYWLLAGWCLVGVIVSVYVDIQTYRFQKRHRIKNRCSFWRTIIAWIIGHIIAVIMWPVALAFYNFWLQEDLNEHLGVQDGAGLL